MSQRTTETGLTPETHHIDVVSPTERHGVARDLFSIWLSANLSIGNAVFGAIAVFVGNSFWWALAAIFVGNGVGAAFMALHSAQGARLGVPQLIQSRGQFGYYGALLPVALAVLLYGGFFVVTAIIGGQALSAAVPSVGVNPSIIVVAALSLVLALLGYRVIHAAARYAVWPLAVSVVIVLVACIVHGGIDYSVGGFSLGAFLTAVGLSATFLLTYAPYVSDYSRYLPENTSPSAMFGWTFAGAFIGTFVAESVGVLLAFQFPDSDSMAAIHDVLGGNLLAVVLLLVGAVAIGGNNALNLYGGMLNLITAASSVMTVRPDVRLRFLMLLPTLIVGLWIAMQASADFIGNLNVFLSFLQLAFVPWGAINLADYYLVRHGHYDVEGFFEPRGPYFSNPATWTRFGVSWKAIIAYAVGVAVALPFVSNAWFAGSFTSAFEGADLSWIPGFVVTGGLYLALTIGARDRDAQAGSPLPRDLR